MTCRRGEDGEGRERERGREEERERERERVIYQWVGGLIHTIAVD